MARYVLPDIHLHRIQHGNRRQGV